MMPCIWLDVTTILRWDRPAVGIVRTESECANYALTLDPDKIRFCFFDSSQKRYIEVTHPEVSAAVAKLRTKKKVMNPVLGNNNSSVQVGVAVSNEQRVKNLILTMIELLPEKLRGKIYNFIVRRKPALQAAICSYREAKIALRQFLRPAENLQGRRTILLNRKASAALHAVPFAANDVYVSLGLDWDQKDFAYLFAEKQRVGFKVLLFCYDIIPVKFPHLCVGDVAAKFAHYFANLAWSADHVLCISECSRADLTVLLNVLGTPIPQIGVVKLGCDLPLSSERGISDEINNIIDGRYILYVSTIERRKNHETLYRAYTRLIDKNIMNLPQLIFVGMSGWGVDDLLLDIKLDPRIKPYIKILNDVSDVDLTFLYQNAYFTVFPSLYEGWGLPVQESLTYGKFCLASNTASIPEVAGDLIEYIDPWDVPAWADRLLWYFENPEEINKHEAVIKSRYKATSWHETGATVINKAAGLI